MGVVEVVIANPTRSRVTAERETAGKQAVIVSSSGSTRDHPWFLKERENN